MKWPLLIAAVLLAILVGPSGCVTMQAEKSAPPLGEFVEIDGQRLHVVDIKSKSNAVAAPIIVIHGASVNLRDVQMSLGEPLSQRHRVLFFDRPGRGYSTRPRDGWRLDKQARLIRDAALALGVERPVVVGQSLGGAVALAYALSFQDEISGLVLLAPVSHKWPTGVAWYNQVSNWPLAGALFRRLVLPVYAPIAAPAGVTKSFAPDTAPEGYYAKSGLGLLFRPADFEANAADLYHLKPQIIEMSRRYASIRLPTAIVTGESDTTVSPAIHSMQLVREIPGATLDLLPRTGHALHHSQTAKVVAAIERIAEGPAPCCLDGVGVDSGPSN